MIVEILQENDRNEAMNPIIRENFRSQADWLSCSFDVALQREAKFISFMIGYERNFQQIFTMDSAKRQEASMVYFDDVFFGPAE